MSLYAVQLTTEAEDNLAEIWLDAEDRSAVTEAEAAIHGDLSSDPTGRGTLVAEGLYKIAYPPLGSILFHRRSPAARGSKPHLAPKLIPSILSLA
jgi:hypothetical protein